MWGAQPHPVPHSGSAGILYMQRSETRLGCCSQVQPLSPFGAAYGPQPQSAYSPLTVVCTCFGCRLRVANAFGVVPTGHALPFVAPCTGEPPSARVGRVAPPCSTQRFCGDLIPSRARATQRKEQPVCTLRRPVVYSPYFACARGRSSPCQYFFSGA